MLKFLFIAFGLLSCAAVVRLSGGKRGTAAIGKPAPDFVLLDDTGVPCTLSNYLGQKVVLYFYPKDFTPGCTKQACTLRTDFSVYAEHNIVILGVSYGSVSSHQKFKAKHHIPFTLLSDSDRSVAKSYGAYKNILNYFFPARMTFLIDERGIIVHIIPSADVAMNAQTVIGLFASGVPD